MAQNVQKSIAWPLIFFYRGTILGRGFLADINLQGRVLACPESDGVWVYGVNPGAVAVSAPTLAGTNIELRETLTKLFVDFAQAAKTFDEFKAVVERFLQESDAASGQEWDAARAAVRAGELVAPKDLRKETESVPWFVNVTEKPIETVTPDDNLLIKQETSDIYETAA